VTTVDAALNYLYLFCLYLICLPTSHRVGVNRYQFLLESLSDLNARFVKFCVLQIEVWPFQSPDSYHKQTEATPGRTGSDLVTQRRGAFLFLSVC